MEDCDKALPFLDTLKREREKVYRLLRHSFYGTFALMILARPLAAALGYAHLSDRFWVGAFHAIIGSLVWGTLISAAFLASSCCSVAEKTSASLHTSSHRSGLLWRWRLSRRTGSLGSRRIRNKRPDADVPGLAARRGYTGEVIRSYARHAHDACLPTHRLVDWTWHRARALSWDRDCLADESAGQRSAADPGEVVSACAAARHRCPCGRYSSRLCRTLRQPFQHYLRLR